MPTLPTNAFEMHVCTCAFGHLAFQVVSVKEIAGVAGFDPISGFESLAVPFWPAPPRGFVWPAHDALRSKEAFYAL
jgi:hypothetical protein